MPSKRESDGSWRPGAEANLLLPASSLGSRGVSLSADSVRVYLSSGSLRFGQRGRISEPSGLYWYDEVSAPGSTHSSSKKEKVKQKGQSNLQASLRTYEWRKASGGGMTC